MEDMQSHIRGSKPKDYSSDCCNAGLDLSNLVGEEKLVRARCLECGKRCEVIFGNGEKFGVCPDSGRLDYLEEVVGDLVREKYDLKEWVGVLEDDISTIRNGLESFRNIVVTGIDNEDC